MIKQNLLRKKLIFLYGLAGTGMLASGLFKPLIPILARRFGASGFKVGFLTSGFMIARGTTAFIIGRRIDQSTRTKMFVQIGFLITALIALTYYFVNNYHTILFLRFCQGICSGLMWPVAQIMVAEEAKKPYRTRALSLYQITGRIGTLLSRALLSLTLFITANLGIGELGSFRIVFVVSSVLLFLGFIEAALMPSYKRSTRSEKKRGRPPYSIFLFGLVFGAMIALAPLSLVFLNEHHNLSVLSISLILLCLDVVTIPVMYASSHFTDRIGVRKSLRIILVPCFLSAISLPFVSSFAVFMSLYITMRVLMSCFMPISRAYAASLDTEIGSNIGTLNMMTNLGSVIGPLVGGLIYDAFSGSLKIAGYAVFATLLLPGILLLMLRRS